MEMDNLRSDFCAFVRHKGYGCYRLYCFGVKKPKIGLFSPTNRHKLLVSFVKAYNIITKVTSNLVFLLVILAGLHSFTSNFCRRLLYA